MRLLHIPTATEWDWVDSVQFDMCSKDSVVLSLSTSECAYWRQGSMVHIISRLESSLLDTYGLAWDYAYTFVELLETTE